MKALFLGTLAASQATPIIEFITADVRTEILDNNEPAQAAAALADTDVLLTGVWRSGFPAAPKVRLLQVPLAPAPRPKRRAAVQLTLALLDLPAPPAMPSAQLDPKARGKAIDG